MKSLNKGIDFREDEMEGSSLACVGMWPPRVGEPMTKPLDLLSAALTSSRDADSRLIDSTPTPATQHANENTISSIATSANSNGGSAPESSSTASSTNY